MGGFEEILRKFVGNLGEILKIFFIQGVRFGKILKKFKQILGKI